MPPTRKPASSQPEKENWLSSWEMDLEEFDQVATESLGGAPEFRFRMKTGAPIVVPHPMLLSDERTEAVRRVELGDDLDRADNDALRTELAALLDPAVFEQVWDAVKDHTRVPVDMIDGVPAEPASVRHAKAILGEAEYRRFVAGGGSAMRVEVAFGKLSEGLTDPKASKR